MSPLGPEIEVELDGGTYHGKRPPVSVVILTFNEQDNIEQAIRSCAWSDDVHVLDSGSTDRTREIALAMGAKVHVNPFKSFGDQRNWAIDNIPCKHPWHFHLDADERFTPEVVHEMRDLLGPDGAATPHVCFLCPSKMIFLGRWIKRSAGYPNYQVRLFRFGKCRFMDFGHGQREVPQGSTGVMVQPYMHYAFSKGLNEWLNKHNAYSAREAEEGVLIRREGRPGLGALLQRDATLRRRAFKNFAYFLRFRAVWRFIYNYVLRFGFLDGPAGFHYCLMISMYEYWIELKIRERQQRWVERTDRVVNDMMAETPAPALMPPTPDAPLRNPETATP
jgi:glycosyltransferase involved in cell wall biosynthesis